MRLSREAWKQLEPLFAGGTGLEFEYHGRPRTGVLDSMGEGPRGAFVTLRHADGGYKSYSLAKVSNLRIVPTPSRSVLARL